MYEVKRKKKQTLSGWILRIFSNKGNKEFVNANEERPVVSSELCNMQCVGIYFMPLCLH
jgi:hypothetical protein